MELQRLGEETLVLVIQHPGEAPCVLGFRPTHRTNTEARMPGRFGGVKFGKGEFKINQAFFENHSKNITTFE